jgi:hypothetical protein
MYTVQEIIDRAKLKVPNNEDVTVQIKIIDNIQKRLYRKYKIPTAFNYEILEGQSFIDVGIIPSKIFDVLVDGESYPNKKLIGTTTDASRYHFFFDTLLGIYPAAKADGTLTVYAYESPESLTSVGQTPSLDGDYHDIFVYGLAKHLAETVQKFDLAAQFRMDYEQLEEELALVYPFTPEVKTIMSESGW